MKFIILGNEGVDECYYENMCKFNLTSSQSIEEIWDE